MVYVQCPCACPFGDGDGMDSRSTSSGGSRRPKRSMPTKATYLHLQWQWRWNRGNSCSTISNVPMFQCSNVCQGDRGTHIRPFGHSAIRHQLQPQIQVLPRGECRECREQGTRETSHAQHILQPNMAHTHLLKSKLVKLGKCRSASANAFAPAPPSVPSLFESAPNVTAIHITMIDHTHQHTQAHTHMLCAVRRAPLSM